MKVSKIYTASGLGVVDRIFGFIFGASKVFLIFSVIAYALYQVQSFRKVMDEKFNNSFVMPHLISVGSVIIKLDTSAITTSVNKVIDTTKTSQVIEDTKNSMKENIQTTTNSVKEAVEEEIVNNVKEKIEDTKNATKEEIDSTKEKLRSIANKPQEN